MKFQKNDVFTGLFVLGGVLLGVGTLGFILGYNLLDDRTQYTIRFESLAGVKKGTAIKLKNFTVGEVTEVEPIFGSTVFFKASVKIDRHLILYRGTKVNISNQNVIGDTVIDLYPALIKADVLEPGHTLFATNIVNLDQMITQISGLIDGVSTLVGTFNVLAGDSRGDIKSLLTNLNISIIKANALMDASQEEILLIMKNVRQTSETLNKFSADFANDPWKILNNNRPPSALP